LCVYFTFLCEFTSKIEIDSYFFVCDKNCRSECEKDTWLRVSASSYSEKVLLNLLLTASPASRRLVASPRTEVDLGVRVRAWSSGLWGP
jgi:hypothetical protein